MWRLCTLQVAQGTQALELLFNTVGLGWAVNLMELPIISKLVDLLYEFLSANRISLGNALVRPQLMPAAVVHSNVSGRHYPQALAGCLEELSVPSTFVVEAWNQWRCVPLGSSLSHCVCVCVLHTHGCVHVLSMLCITCFAGWHHCCKAD